MIFASIVRRAGALELSGSERSMRVIVNHWLHKFARILHKHAGTVK
jgi:hypothetical protein